MSSQLIMQVLGLPLRTDVALSAPLGGSTGRFALVDINGGVFQELVVPSPGKLYTSLTDLVAAAFLHFGFRTQVVVCSIAGVVPRRGAMLFTNISEWGPIDPDCLSVLGVEHVEWFNDGPAGFFGVDLLNPNDLVVLNAGRYQPGDPTAYAIFGTGMNTSTGTGFEMAHPPFAARSDLEWRYWVWLSNELKRTPDWEDACSGGVGFEHAARFMLGRHVWFGSELETAMAASREPSREVTALALDGNPTAQAATKLAFEILGGWLGSLAVGLQLNRIAVSGGILGDPALREFMLAETKFLVRFSDQGRPGFCQHAARCRLEVCLANPEELGSRARAAQLLVR